MVCFDDLSTVKFQNKMKPKAVAIYQRLFKGCSVEDLREKGVKVHVLDQEFGIDALIRLKTGQWISIQEKYRKNTFLTNSTYQVIPGVPDFTQEYKNAAGTEYESDGEWSKLGAQLYFYGWANKDETDFQRWFVMDIAKYKILVERAGGLAGIGVLKPNKKHGRSSFYAIPASRLRSSFVFRDVDSQSDWMTERAAIMEIEGRSRNDAERDAVSEMGPCVRCGGNKFIAISDPQGKRELIGCFECCYPKNPENVLRLIRA